MRNRVEVIVECGSCKRVRWTFDYLSGHSGGMVLNSWHRETRASKRHKWRSSQIEGTSWLRSTGECRNNRVSRPVPPKEVHRLALSKFAESLTWKEGEVFE